MKTKFVLTVIALALVLQSFGQKTLLKLTFTAAKNNIRIRLDSIRVTNVTLGGDTVLFWPDTVLMLGNEVGLPGEDMVTEGLKVYQNYPNPFTDQTTIKVDVPEMGVTNLFVTDILGRKILSIDKMLEKGQHLFRFTPTGGGVYFFTAQSKGNAQSIKILSRSCSSQSPALDYAGSDSPRAGLKSQTAAPVLAYEPGDSLYYIGYVHLTDEITASNVLADTPDGDSTYYFQMTEGVPCPDVPAFIYQNHLYETVKIGTQCWMKGNLVNTSYRNGDSIQNVTGDAEWYSLLTGAYCNYNNYESNGIDYGRLYNGFAMIDNRCLCPEGWHVPSNDIDVQALIDYYGGNAGLIGGYLKATGDAWASPNTGADNRSGFTGLPGGARYDWNGSYHDLYYYGYWWTSTHQSGVYDAYQTVYLWYDRVWFTGTTHPIMNGLSVRCIKDQ